MDSVPVTCEVELGRAALLPDIDRVRAWLLTLDGSPQSYVDLDDPEHIEFEYARRLAHVIDLAGRPRAALDVLHLGGGALTLPRYTAATRPGSRQHVVEVDAALIAFVRTHLPLPPDARVTVEAADARAAVAARPDASADVVVADVFGGARIPAHVTSAEFYAECADLLAEGGVLLVNVADGTGLRFARSQAATLRHVLADVAVLAESGVLRGRRYGNLVLVASDRELPLEWLPRLLAGGPHPAQLVHGAALRDWIAGAPVVTDATAIPSPPPSRSVFQLRPGDR